METNRKLTPQRCKTDLVKKRICLHLLKADAQFLKPENQNIKQPNSPYTQLKPQNFNFLKSQNKACLNY